MMKLSFSINGWKEHSWQEFVDLADEIGFKGIELHNVLFSDLSEKNGPFHKYNSAATMRKLNDSGISVPCVDISKDISTDSVDENAEYINNYIDFASSIRVPYVRVYASGKNENARENVVSCLSKVIDYAAEKKVIVLIETVGMFADTAKKYGIYDKSKDYSPLSVLHAEDLKQMMEDNSLVEGFCMAIKEMSFGDKAFTMFYSEYGYGAR